MTMFLYRDLDEYLSKINITSDLMALNSLTGNKKTFSRHSAPMANDNPGSVRHFVKTSSSANGATVAEAFIDAVGHEKHKDIYRMRKT
uniref:Uncharacterized protein n=1 Tax=Romanomermis culicivorax TaxID=13658 RepID=A0A915IPD9_ROMCU